MPARPPLVIVAVLCEEEFPAPEVQVVHRVGTEVGQTNARAQGVAHAEHDLVAGK